MARRRERPEVHSTNAGHVEKHPRADEDTPENELGMEKTDREAPENLSVHNNEFPCLVRFKIGPAK